MHRLRDQLPSRLPRGSLICGHKTPNCQPMTGQFGFISGQLRDIQRYMHVRFDDLARKFDGVAGKVDGLRNDLPQIVVSAVTDVMRQR